ncbi:hypothetical protein LCGC14_0838250 [marine sediment metagenome]|uniref:Uncharacterized protein n=1 Tax=marine sediment metagenome TaxID=412755 RepID=A0A0F9SL62_9ZZZZ
MIKVFDILIEIWIIIDDSTLSKIEKLNKVKKILKLEKK